MAQPANAKIDKTRLHRMLTREGKSPSECARYFGVSPAAITQAKRRLNLNMTKSVALERATEVVDAELDAAAQLQKINNYANELLDLLMRWNRGDDEALQILETQVRKVRIGRGEEAQEITEYKFQDPRQLALKAMQEIRGQLSLQLDIFKTLNDMQAVAAFQKTVLETIGECAPEIREKIVSALKEQKAIRSSVQM